MHISENDTPFSTIAEAFSRTAEKYDALNHPHLWRMRNKVYSHVSRVFPPGGRILELNAGTGIDAVALAQRGYRVHATDIAPDMLRRLQGKVDQLGLNQQVTVQRCSFTELGQVQGAPFDAIFSDLGGLNCVPDLSPIIADLPKLLRPGGVVTWVLMPPICLWEMAEVFRGHFRLAFRRLSPTGVLTHLEGLHFPVYYFTPQKVISWFGADYQCLALEGLSVITPTGQSKNLAIRFPRFYRSLSWLDDQLSTHSPWWGWGDFFMLSMRYQPK